jgi:hypothetical protein
LFHVEVAAERLQTMLHALQSVGAHALSPIGIQANAIILDEQH